MKMNRTKLESIIRQIINERYCHDDKGHFTKCEKGTVFSMTKKGADTLGIDQKYVRRGTVTSKGMEDGPPKMTSRFGMNSGEKTSAGRKTIDGKDINPVYRVKGYKKKYSEKNEEAEPEEDEVLLITPGEVRKIVVEELTELFSQLSPMAESKKRKCPTGCMTFNEILIALNNLVRSSKGSLMDKEKA